MKCDKCDNEATVHEVNIKGGKRHEKHLCEKCARADGVSIVHAGPTVESMLETFIAVKTSKEAGAASADAAQGKSAGAATACAACGRTFAQFRSSGVLGCPQCYSAFEHQLGPLLGRAHEGGTHHVGKTPRSMSGVSLAGTGAGVGGSGGVAGAGAGAAAGAAASMVIEVEKRLKLLRASLDDAVAGEQYEKAAKIRDELQRLQSRVQQQQQQQQAGGAAPEKGGSEEKPAAGRARRRSREEPM